MKYISVAKYENIKIVNDRQLPFKEINDDSVSIKITEEKQLNSGIKIKAVCTVQKPLKSCAVRLISKETDWNTDNYVFAPAALYNGNRFDCVNKQYPQRTTCIDAIMNQLPYGDERGFVMFFNQTDKERTGEITLPIYYTGLTDLEAPPAPFPITKNCDVLYPLYSEEIAPLVIKARDGLTRTYITDEKVVDKPIPPLSKAVDTDKTICISAEDKNPQIYSIDSNGNVHINETTWDRSLLFALRGVFLANKAETGIKETVNYCRNRLLGSHCPYPFEAFPEGNRAHLAAESLLFARIITEGLFGLRAVGLKKLRIKPQISEACNKISLENIKLFSECFDITANADGISLNYNGNVYKTDSLNAVFDFNTCCFENQD